MDIWLGLLYTHNQDLDLASTSFYLLQKYFLWHWLVFDTAQIHNSLLELGTHAMHAEDRLSGDSKTLLAL